MRMKATACRVIPRLQRDHCGHETGRNQTDRVRMTPSARVSVYSLAISVVLAAMPMTRAAAESLDELVAAAKAEGSVMIYHTSAVADVQAGIYRLRQEVRHHGPQFLCDRHALVGALRQRSCCRHHAGGRVLFQRHVDLRGLPRRISKSLNADSLPNYDATAREATAGERPGCLLGATPYTLFYNTRRVLRRLSGLGPGRILPIRNGRAGL